MSGYSSYWYLCPVLLVNGLSWAKLINDKTQFPIVCIWSLLIDNSIASLEGMLAGWRTDMPAAAQTYVPPHQQQRQDI